MTVVSKNFANTFLYFQKVGLFSTRIITHLISQINNKITCNKIKCKARRFLVQLNYRMSTQIQELHADFNKLHSELHIHVCIYPSMMLDF